jgi:hypothetical protein
MKYIVPICIGILTFLALQFIDTAATARETSYTLTVPKSCILTEVVAGADYLFECPR